MKLKDLQKMVCDVPDLFPKELRDGKMISLPRRSEIVPKKLLCCHDDYVAMQLEDGRYAAMWTNHLDVADTMDDLLKLLNQYERTLLALKHGADEGH